MAGKLVCAFPGQGIQKRGMAKELLDTKVWHLFEKASTILGYDLGKLCLDGPDRMLQETARAQPAVFVTCYALWELYKDFYQPDYFIGHSLGEITALAAAGAFPFEAAVSLVAARGKYMQKESPPGGMAAIIALNSQVIEELCAEISRRNPDNYVQIANENAPGQIVVSGTLPGLEKLAELSVAKGARRVIRLNVSGPFHSALMAGAAKRFGEFLENFPIQSCQVPVLSNDGRTFLQKPEDIKARLVSQIYSPVRFVASIEKLAGLGVQQLVESGPEMLLIPMARRIEPKLQLSLVRKGGM